MLRYHNFHHGHRLLENDKPCHHDFGLDRSVLVPQHLECSMVRVRYSSSAIAATAGVLN